MSTADDEEESVTSSSEGEREDWENLQREIENSYVVPATNLRNQLQYAQAGFLYQRAAERLCDNASSDDDISHVLDIIFSACSAFLDAGLPEEAKSTMLQWDIPSQDYQFTLKFNNRLESVLVMLGDSAAEAKILSTIDLIINNEGADSLAVALQYSMVLVFVLLIFHTILKKNLPHWWQTLNSRSVAFTPKTKRLFSV